MGYRSDSIAVSRDMGPLSSLSSLSDYSIWRSRRLFWASHRAFEFIVPKYDLSPITSFDGPLLGVKKSRSRGKDETVRQGKAKMRKKTNVET